MERKNLISKTLIVLALILQYGCANKCKINLEVSEWSWKSSNGHDQFTIKIEDVSKKSIQGQYCATIDSANRIDCNFDSEYNLKGFQKDCFWEIEFYSFYGAKNGKAIIELKDSNLLWKITKWPEGGDCYAPESVTLSRK